MRSAQQRLDAALNAAGNVGARDSSEAPRQQSPIRDHSATPYQPLGEELASRQLVLAAAQCSKPTEAAAYAHCDEVDNDYWGPPPPAPGLPHAEAMKARHRNLEGRLESALSGSLASRATTKRRKPKATPMKNGWYAAYDYSVARPYYFQPNSGVVQWQPPPGQPACLISYGKSPHQNAAPQPMHQVFRNDRAAMLESPAPSEIGD